MLFAFYITAEFSCKVEIFEQGGLEPIIKLLSSTDCDVQVFRQFFSLFFQIRYNSNNYCKLGIYSMKVSYKCPETVLCSIQPAELKLSIQFWKNVS